MSTITSNNNENKKAKTDKDAELARLREENDRLKEALGAIKDDNKEKLLYYLTLVWSARRTPEEFARSSHLWFDDAKKGLSPATYQGLLHDLDLLGDSEKGDFHHGFNSGCLAMARLNLGLAVSEDKVWDDDCSYDSDGELIGEPYVHTAAEQRKEASQGFPDLDS